MTPLHRDNVQKTKTMQAPHKRVVLIGNPNCGKTAIFNALTGSKQKIANYAGVTVERKIGRLSLSQGQTATTLLITDLPGTYSLQPQSLDEEIAIRVIQGEYAGEPPPDAVVMVLDATHLLRGLRLLMAVRRLGLPIIVAVNFMDIAEKQGRSINVSVLEQALGLPVVPCVAIHPQGTKALKNALALLPNASTPTNLHRFHDHGESTLQADHFAALQIMNALGFSTDDIHPSNAFSHRLDRVLLHPLWGMAILIAVLFSMFQAVFSWAEWPMTLIESSVSSLAELISTHLPESILKGLLVEGVLAGVGGVLMFLPQILILFFFIIVLEEMGYLPRAALLMDRLMASVGLTGRAFIPLLSSFACAIPGIMATRTIPDMKSRWITIMIAPLMTCSARLPVYVLLIAAFIPPIKLAGGIELQGLIMFSLYFLGVLSAMIVAYVLRWWVKLPPQDTLLMELPDYRMPYWRNVLIGLWQRAKVFLKRMGTTILLLSILLWFVSTYPKAPPEAEFPAIEYSFAGKMGKSIAPLFAPIGFNWQISVSLVPGLAAREVMVSALSTIYAVESPNSTDEQHPADTDVGMINTQDSASNEAVDSTEQRLIHLLSSQWSLPTALALLAWFIFAPMCFPTIVTVRKELDFKAAVWMVVYQFSLAYMAAWVVFQLATRFL